MSSVPDPGVADLFIGKVSNIWTVSKREQAEISLDIESRIRIIPPTTLNKEFTLKFHESTDTWRRLGDSAHCSNNKNDKRLVIIVK